jgi:hypothetical protein
MLLPIMLLVAHVAAHVSSIHQAAVSMLMALLMLMA